MSGEDRTRRTVLKKVAGTASLASIGLAGQAEASVVSSDTEASGLPSEPSDSELSTEAYVCSDKDCPPPPGECNCYYECACVNNILYERECCCCDDDGRDGCSGWTAEGYCY